MKGIAIGSASITQSGGTNIMSEHNLHPHLPTYQDILDDLVDTEMQLTAIKSYLDATIQDLNDAEREISNMHDARKRQNAQLADYSVKTQALIGGIEGWLNAYQDTMGYDERDRIAIEILNNWVRRQTRVLPEYRVDENGKLSIYDDIPF